MGRGYGEFDASEEFGFSFTNGSMPKINTHPSVRDEKEEHQQQTVRISPLTLEFTPFKIPIESLSPLADVIPAQIVPVEEPTAIEESAPEREEISGAAMGRTQSDSSFISTLCVRNF